MDNQQIRLSALKRLAARAWIAGMIDADGCIAFMSRDRKGYTTHEPYVDVASINSATIVALQKSFEFIGTGCFVTQTTERGLTGIRCSGIKRSHGLLSQVVDFMVTKQLEAELIIEYCLSRLKSRDRNKFAPCTPEELEYVDFVKRAKTLRNLRDYTPVPWWLKQGDDIVRTSGESLRTEAEMTSGQSKD